MKITIFSEELRKCLNAAGLSDCGENDAWNYWYQRLMNAYNESVERQIMTEQAENTKLRQMVWVMRDCLADECKRWSEYVFPCEIDHDMQELGIGICDLATDGELGIEVDE